MQNFTTIDEYIESFPETIQKTLQELRTIVREEIPGAEETIRYGLPTFRLNNKNVVHFGGYKTHIGFYPAPSGIEAFEKDLAKYQSGKGTLQFSLGEELPWELIRKVTRHRVGEVKGK
jgi:uncharacterized protein YdhG (YjbR/CyaY superfamily)